MVEIIVYIVMAIITASIMLTRIMSNLNIEDAESEWIPVILSGVLWPAFWVIMLSIIVFAIGVEIAEFVYKKILEKIK